MSTQASTRLIRHTEESYGDTFRADVFDLYKHYVESAEKISERRVTANNYLLTVNVSLVTIYGIVVANGVSSNWIVLLPLAGIIVSTTWYRIITSYRNLNAVKFMVIHELEQYMPVALYDYEWYRAGRGQEKIYRPVSRLEIWVPITFVLLYAILAVVEVVDFAANLKVAGP